MSKKDVPAFDYMSKLKPGLKGEIVINAGIYKGRYATRIEDLREESIGLAHPLLKGALLPTYRDMSFTFSIEDGGALYVFDMSVRRLDTQTGLPILWGTINDYPKRIQRRQFLRVSCLWDISIFHLDMEAKSPLSARWLDARAIDVSLGGCRFRLSDDAAGDLAFESGESLLVRFNLAGHEYFQIGRTSRIVHNPRTWEVGVVFDSVPVSVEKKLFEYIRQQEIMGRDQNQ